MIRSFSNSTSLALFTAATDILPVGRTSVGMFRWVKRLKRNLARPERTVPQRCHDDRGFTSDDERDVFRFAPELFEVRTDVIAELSDRGFDWVSHYSAVDPMHDVYGIEVCGIRDQDDAISDAFAKVHGGDHSILNAPLLSASRVPEIGASERWFYGLDEGAILGSLGTRYPPPANG